MHVLSVLFYFQQNCMENNLHDSYYIQFFLSTHTDCSMLFVKNNTGQVLALPDHSFTLVDLQIQKPLVPN